MKTIGKLDDMINNEYHYLKIIKRDISNKDNVIAECKCGKKFSTNGYAVIKSRTKSCGCKKIEDTIERNIKNKKHGLYKNKLYHIHNKMISRCHNPLNKDYKYYGAKGVVVCNEWKSEDKGVIAFYEWANSNGYEEGLSVDRIDSNGNYEPNNCRWITMSENIAKRNREHSKKNKK